MALTPDQIDALPTYTSAQQLKIWQRANVELATTGVSVASNGKQLTRADASMVLDQIRHWQEMADAEAGNGGAGMGEILVTLV